MKVWIIYIYFILLWIPPASADITWVQSCSITAHPGDNITCGNLHISNIQFSQPVRGVKDFNKNIVLEHTVTPGIVFDISGSTFSEKRIFLTPADASYINQTTKSIRIDVSGFPDGNSKAWLIESYNPSAILTIYTRRMPQVQLSLTSDKPVYDAGKDMNINITLSIKNTDTNQLKPVRFVFNRGNLNISKIYPYAQSDYAYCCLNPSQTIRSIYNLDVPDVKLNTTYSINATIKLEDDLNKTMIYNLSISIIVIPQNNAGHVTVTKFIRDRFYTNDNASVVLSIINQGKYSLYGVIVDDTLPAELYPVNSSQKLNWYIPEIKADGGVELKYQVYPVNSGKANLPAATVRYSYFGQDYQTHSNQVSTDIISNPYVKLRTKYIVVQPEQTRAAPTPRKNLVNPSASNKTKQGGVPRPPMVTPITPASKLPTPSPASTDTPAQQATGFVGVEVIGMFLFIVGWCVFVTATGLLLVRIGLK